MNSNKHTEERIKETINSNLSLEQKVDYIISLVGLSQPTLTVEQAALKELSEAARFIIDDAKNNYNNHVDFFLFDSYASRLLSALQAAEKQLIQ